MYDLTHDHLELGFHDGCPGCEQTIRDLESSTVNSWLTTYAVTHGGLAGAGSCRQSA